MPYLGLKSYEINAFILIIDNYKAKELNVEECSRKTLEETGSLLNDNKWRAIKNRLLQVAYQFIFLQQSKNTHYSRLEVASYLLQNQANKNLKLYLQNTEKQILKEPQGLDNEYHKFRLNELKLIQKQSLIEKMKELKEMDKAFDNFYLVNKLRLLTEMYNRRNVMNDNILGLDTTVSSLEYAFDLDHSSEIIKISNTLLSLIKHRRHTDYSLVQQVMNDIQHLLSDDFKVDINTYLLNFCTNAFNRGEEIYAHEYIALIKKMIKKELLVKNKILSQGKYINTLTFAIAIREMNWLRSFIKKFSKYLPQENRETIKMIDEAHIEFYDGNIEKASIILQKVKSQDPYLKIKCRKLLLQIHFEEGTYKLLNSELEAMRNFFYRNQILSEKKRVTALNFIKIMKALVNGDKVNLNQYKGKITLLDRLWLSKYIKKDNR